MAFKIASSTSAANESISSMGSKEFLIISLEDQVCLDSIPGWECKLPEENGNSDSIAPPLLPTQKTPLESAVLKHFKDVDEECTIINSDRVEGVKRKIFTDHVVEEASKRRTASRSDIFSCEGVKLLSLRCKTVGRADETSMSKRPRSLPDFRNRYVKEEDSVDDVPSDGKEAAAREDHRLKSLVSTSRGGLWKDSPVSRSLNSISDIQNSATLFRRRPTVHTDALTDPRHGSPSPDAASSDAMRSTTSNKKSCVRRLDLDDANILLQNSGGVAKNGQQSSVHKDNAGTGSCEQFSSERAFANLSSKRRLLGSFSKTGRNNGKKPVTHIEDLHTPPENMISKSAASGHTQNIPGNSNNLPVSQQYKLGPDTQRALMSGFGEDSFCASERLGDSGRHQTPLETVQIGTEKSRDSLGFSIDINNSHASEELLPGSQRTRYRHHVERENSTQRDTLEGSQITESQCQPFEDIARVLSSVRSMLPTTQPQGLTFTLPQIKSMCEVLNRLYSL